MNKKMLTAVYVFSFITIQNYAKNTEKPWCDEIRKVRIATEGSEFKPFKSFKPVFKNVRGLSQEVGKIAEGLEVELLQRIFKKMPCYQAEFVHNFDSVGEIKYFDQNLGQEVSKSKGPIEFAALFPGLNILISPDSSADKKYAWDMTIATTGIKQERRDKFNMEFSKSYFTPRKHFFGKQEIQNIPDSLSGKTIGVKANTLFSVYTEFLSETLMAKGKQGINIIPFDDTVSPAFDKIFEALKNAQIEYTLSDDELLLEAKASDPELESFNLVGSDLITSFGGEKFGEGVGVGFRKDDVKLINSFNKSLDKVIQNCYRGGYKSIYEKYFNSPSSLISHCK